MLGEAFHFCRFEPSQAPMTSLLIAMAVNWSHSPLMAGGVAGVRQ
jgi:hypothetical protein